MKRKANKTAKSVSPSAKSAAQADSKAAPDRRNAAQKRADAIRTSAQRETVEAFVVAFILALLFRAFIAEAFVIPTGSMAPTLMGAHKDLVCQQCEHEFQVGASKERRGPFQDDTVVAGVCPNCRYLNNLDLAGESSHETFNGDRILVSKYAYAIDEPERWDVIVFKFPGNPKQNYIKRLVGLPNETLSIQYGDVFVGPPGSKAGEQILRKPPHKLMAMRHHVYDSTQQAELLVQAAYPSRLQPWRPGADAPPTDSWTIERDEAGLTAAVQAGDSEHWLRYFHHWPGRLQWDAAVKGERLDDVDPYQGRLITDFYAYDCYVTVPSRALYETAPSNARMSGSVPFDPDYESGGPLSQFGPRAKFGERGFADEGLHWVGDLIAQANLETSADCQGLTLELVEAGVRYQCRLDLSSGQAELFIFDGDQRLPFTAADGTSVESVRASTEARSGEAMSVRFSNCDDQLLLWINGELVAFDGPNTFDSRAFRPAKENHPHHDPGRHPLDASPVGIAVRGGSATVSRFQLDRDKYYVATDSSSFGIFDYDMNELFSLAQENISFRDIQAVMGQPELWKDFPAWQTRRKVSFRLEEDQFFPMGDNSPESLDARCWAGTKRGPNLPDRFREQAYRYADASYVPRDLLVGKALMVFWPHPWNSPVPFTPNFDRFRLIR